MSLDIGRALRSGADDLTSETGVLVGAVFLLYSLGSLVASQSLAAELLQRVFATYTSEQREAIESFGGGTTTPFAVDIGLPIIVVLVVIVTLAGEFVRYWGIRSFAGPDEAAAGEFGDRAVMAVVLGGGVALATLFFQSVLPTVGQLGGLATTLIGSLVGPVVGLALVTVFVYLRQEIALGEGGYATTVKNSFARFMDDPVSVVVLLVVLGILGLLGGIPGVVVTFTVGSGAVAGVPFAALSGVFSTVLSTVFQVLGIATVTDAYLQLRASASESAV